MQAILSAHPTGQLVLAEYESSGILLRRKHEMIHILVANMIDRTGHM